VVSVGLKKRGGPVTVSVWRGEPAWCMRTAAVCGPQPRACFGLRGSGPAVIRWKPPGMPEQTCKVAIPERMPDDGLESLLGP
jgi:hypothetical protein